MADEDQSRYDKRHLDDLEHLRVAVRALERVAITVPERFGEEFAGLRVTVINVAEDVKELKALLEAKFITRAEFDPVKRIVYGLVGLLLTSLVLAGVGLLLRGRG